MKYYRIASLLLLLLGFGHNLSGYLMEVPESMGTVLSDMKKTIFLGMNLYDMNLGFSNAMGFLLISIGSSGIIAKEVYKRQLIINIVTMVVLSTIAITSFFIVPQMMTIVSLLLFIVSYKEIHHD